MALWCPFWLRIMPQCGIYILRIYIKCYNVVDNPQVDPNASYLACHNNRVQYDDDDDDDDDDDK